MIIRVQKNSENPFVKLNKEFLSNKNLSWKAKGILAYLLSCSNDLIISEKNMRTISMDGKESLSAGIKELIKHGYIKRGQTKNSKGEFNGIDYIIFEKPLSYFGLSNKNTAQISKHEKNYNDLINVYSKEKILELKNMPYPEYLKTMHWKILSSLIKTINNKTCFYCGENKNVSLNAHHKTYERKGHENLSDLICICSKCHTLIHKEEIERKLLNNLRKEIVL